MSFTVCAINTPTLFALIDGNNFFVSCERVFNPALNNKPVIVLSSNDGCAIARSNEAKALGIAMGAPLHTFSHLLKPHDIRILSCNFELYGDLSNRMMHILQKFTPDVDIYSIDEAFLDISRLHIHNHTYFAQSIYETVLKYIGIPITIGIAITKTLAKIANRTAKKQQKVHAILTTQNETTHALQATDLSNVWGIGRALTPKLKKLGLYTAHDLSIKDPLWARKVMGISGERLVRELQGISCHSFSAEEADKKSIQVTRSFGVRLREFKDIAEAISAHATRLGEQLRQRKLLTPTLSVFCRTSLYSGSTPYNGIAIITFETPTNDTSTLIKGALQALKKAFQPGYIYQSAGIHALNLAGEGTLKQKNLFSSTQRTLETNTQSKKLNQAIDTLNQRHGKNTLFWASSGINPSYSVRQNHCSPRYTTRWSELRVVR
ncbi:MAG: Y-family DNA polymerase [Pseudomonadota bacterium]